MVNGVETTQPNVGDTVDIEFYPNEGYALRSSAIDCVAIDNTTFVMPDASVTITAEFVKEYNIIFSTQPSGEPYPGGVNYWDLQVLEGGTYSVNGHTLEFNPGFDVYKIHTVTATSYDGFTFTEWIDANGNTITGTEVTVTSDMEFIACFDIATYEVSVVVDGTGSDYGTLASNDFVSGSNTITAEYGTKITCEGDTLNVGTKSVVFTPTEGYEVDYWHIPSDIVDSDMEVRAYIGTIGIDVSFPTWNQYNGTADANYYSSELSSLTLKFLDESVEICDVNGVVLKTVNITPKKSDYGFTGWFVGDTMYHPGDSASVTSDVEVGFEYDSSYGVTILSTEGGTVSGLPLMVNDGDTLIFHDGGIDDEMVGLVTVEPSNGYVFSRWLDSDGNELSKDYTITGPITVTAEFTPIKYNLLFGSTEGGSIDWYLIKVSHGSGYTIVGNILTIDGWTVTATPDDMYQFSGWVYDDGSTVSGEDKVESDRTIRAEFKRTGIQLDLTGVFGDFILTSDTSLTLTFEGMKVTITGATCNEVVEYPFYDEWCDYIWMVNGAVASESVTITEDSTVTIDEMVKDATVTFESNDDNHGTVSIGSYNGAKDRFGFGDDGTIYFDGTIVGNADPSDGYEFDHWDLVEDASAGTIVATAIFNVVGVDLTIVYYDSNGDVCTNRISDLGTSITLSVTTTVTATPLDGEPKSFDAGAATGVGSGYWVDGNGKVLPSSMVVIKDMVIGYLPTSVAIDITISASEGGSVSDTSAVVYGDNIHHHGMEDVGYLDSSNLINNDHVEIVAIADEGYLFKGWYVGDVPIDEASVTDGTQVVAKFERMMQSVNLCYKVGDNERNASTIQVPRGSEIHLDGETLKFMDGNTVLKSVTFEDNINGFAFTGCSVWSGQVVDRHMSIDVWYGDGSVDVYILPYYEGGGEHTGFTSMVQYCGSDVTLEYDTIANQLVIKEADVGEHRIMMDQWNIWGYEFSGWLDSDGNQFDFTKTLTSNTVIVAKFVPVECTVTIDPSKSGVEYTGKTTFEVPYGMEIRQIGEILYIGQEQIVLSLPENHHLRWCDLDGQYFMELIVNEDVTILPLAEKEMGGILFDEMGGTLLIDGTSSELPPDMEFGSTFTIDIVPMEGFTLGAVHVTYGGGDLKANDDGTYTMPNGPLFVFAELTPGDFTITVTDPLNGSIDLLINDRPVTGVVNEGHTEYAVKAGDVVTLVGTPDEPTLGLKCWNVNRTEGSLVDVQENRFVVGSDVTVSADFSTLYNVVYDSDTVNAAEGSTVYLRPTSNVGHYTVWTVTYGENQTVDVTYKDQTTGEAYFTMPASDVTVSVSYEPRTYSIYVEGLYADYISVTDGQNAISGAEMDDTITLAVETPAGHVFHQWGVYYVDINGVKNDIYVDIVEGSHTFIMPPADVMVFAVFEPMTYTVSWIDEDGTVLETDEKVAYGTMPSYDGETPTKESTPEFTYTFAGWSPEIAAVTGDATYTATYDSVVNSYKIIWIVDGVRSEVTMEYGSTPDYGSDPTKESTPEFTYTFAGWSPEIAAVTGDATYTAQFTATTNTYTVTWYGEDGTTVLDTSEVAYGTVPSYPGTTEPTKASTEQYTYDFAGWSPEITTVTGDITYTAQFDQTVNTYTVSFVTGSDTTIDGIAVEYGKAVDEPAVTPDKEGHTFTGWYTDSGCTTEYDFSTLVTGDLTLYAGWEVSTYAVSVMNVENGSITTSSTEFAFGSEVFITVTPAEGYGLVSLAVTYGAESTLVQVTDNKFTMPAGDVTITAAFKSVYTVTFTGVTMDPITAVDGSVITLSTPSKSGHTFNGWYDGDVMVSSPYVVTKDVTLDAKFTVIPSTPSGGPTSGGTSGGSSGGSAPGQSSTTTTNPDGSTTTTETTRPVTNPDGSQTTTESTTNRDQDGNVTGTVDKETTTNTTTDEDTGAVTETKNDTITSKDENGNVTGTTEVSKETTTNTVVDQETGSSTESKVESETTTVKDENGNVTETMEKEVVTETKTDSTGTVVETTTEKVTVTDSEGNEKVTETTETTTEKVDDAGTQINAVERTEKDETGKVTETKTETAISADGTETKTDSTVKKDENGNVTEKVEIVDITSADGSLVSKIESTTDSTGRTEVVSETTLAVTSDQVTQEDIEAAIEQTRLVNEKHEELGIDTKTAVVLDVSSMDVDELEVPAAAIDSIKGADSELSIRTQNGSIRLPAEVMENISSGAENVKLSVNVHRYDGHDEHRKEILKDKHAMDFNIHKDGERVHHLGGRVSVTIEYTLKPGQQPEDLRMYYLDEDNKTHLVESYYDERTGKMVMFVTHFSVYYVGEYSQEGKGTGYVEDNTLLYAGVAVAVVAVIAAAAYAIRHRS